jgi:hypothetical protein
MSRSILLFLTRGIALGFFACGGADVDPSAPLPTYEEREVLFVDPDKLYSWMEAGHREDVVFVDNRFQSVFEQSHVEGARLMPTDRVKSSIGTLPLNKWLIMYCT